MIVDVHTTVNEQRAMELSFNHFLLRIVAGLEFADDGMGESSIFCSSQELTAEPTRGTP